MNGIDKITARLESEAHNEAEATLAEAEKKCAVIHEEYDKKAKALYADLITEGEAALKADAERQESSLAMQEKKELLAVKQEMVSAAFDRARTLLAQLPEDKYVAFLASQAAGAAQNGEGEILLNAHDRDAYGAKVAAAANGLLQKDGKAAKLVLSGDCGEMAAGLILRCGDVEVNCTAETLLALCRDKMAAPVAGILFPS